MEGLEERGKGRILSEWEEREQYWRGGGWALRAKRGREWDVEGWEEWELQLEGRSGVKGDGRSDEEDNEGCEKDGSDGSECQMREHTIEGDGGSEEGRNAEMMGREGEAVGETSSVTDIPPKRKPLKGGRGTRRAKAKEEARRLAKSMSSWLLKPT